MRLERCERLHEKKGDVFARVKCPQMLRILTSTEFEDYSEGQVDPVGWAKVFIWRKVAPARIEGDPTTKKR